MSITLQAVIAPTIAPAVQLTITATSPLATLMRSDRNGIHAVRAASLQLSDGQLVLVDYEPAYGDVSYEAQTATGETSNATVNFPTSLPVIHAVHRPTVWARISTISDYSHQRTSATSITQALDGQYPAVTYGVMYSRSMSIAISTATYAEAANLEYVFSQTGALMLRQSEHDGLDAYLAVTSTNIAVSEAQGAYSRWTLSLTANEIAYPPGATQTALVNTYGDNLTALATYATAAAHQKTYYERVSDL